MTILRVLRETDSDPNVLDQHPAKAALESYQQLLENHRYLDYDEMLLRAVVELESSEELREAIRNRVKYLTVDEYQDVNPIQEFLIRQIHDLGANLCVVGDDDQNVYQWRGSDVRHIVEFSRYPDVAQVPLTVNFGSSPAVVYVSREAVEVNSNRLAKEMQGGGKRQFERGDILCLKFKDPQAEADWIADKIQLRPLPEFGDCVAFHPNFWKCCFDWVSATEAKIGATEAESPWKYSQESGWIRRYDLASPASPARELMLLSFWALWQPVKALKKWRLPTLSAASKY